MTDSPCRVFEFTVVNHAEDQHILSALWLSLEAARKQKVTVMSDQKYGVLLVEHEPMLCIMYEDILKDTEFLADGVAICAADALEWLDSNRLDVAIVNFDHQDNFRFLLVERLQTLGMPFLITSMLNRPENSDLMEVPWLAKPFEDSRLLELLREVAAKIPRGQRNRSRA